jgi:hypothetical protein
MNGRDAGFDALTAYAEAGKGLFVMINGNDNTHLMQGNKMSMFSYASVLTCYNKKRT